MKAKVIAIGNLKGGVGKTTSTVAIAYDLAKRGKKVLVVDNDKQGDASRQFGRRTVSGKGIDAIIGNDEVNTKELIQRTEYDGLDIITANLNLLVAIDEASRDYTRPTGRRLKKALDQVAGEYDYILIDCAPDINLSIVNAIVAADFVLIPLKVDGNTIEGIDIFLNKIHTFAEAWDTEKKDIRIFLTQLKKNNTDQMDGARTIVKKMVGKQEAVMDTYIADSDPIVRSSKQHKPIQKCSPRSGAARNYRNLTDELLEIMEGKA